MAGTRLAGSVSLGQVCPQTLAAFAVTYWGLGTEPIARSCFGIEARKWPEMYERAVGFVRKVFDEATNDSLDAMRAKAFALAGVSPKSSQSERMVLCAAGRFGGKSLYAPFTPTPKFGWLLGSMCHFQKTTARNIRSQPHDLLRCQLGRPLTNPKSQANVGVRNNSCYALHPG